MAKFHCDVGNVVLTVSATRPLACRATSIRTDETDVRTDGCAEELERAREHDAAAPTNDERVDRITLSQGAAHFEVHPHDRRRVLIELPEGEFEDMGTVFDVSVAAGATRRIAVSAGRVATRLSGRPEFRSRPAKRGHRAWSRPPRPRRPSARPASRALLLE